MNLPPFFEILKCVKFHDNLLICRPALDILGNLSTGPSIIIERIFDNEMIEVRYKIIKKMLINLSNEISNSHLKKTIYWLFSNVIASGPKHIQYLDRDIFWDNCMENLWSNDNIEVKIEVGYCLRNFFTVADYRTCIFRMKKHKQVSFQYLLIR